MHWIEFVGTIIEFIFDGLMIKDDAKSWRERRREKKARKKAANN